MLGVELTSILILEIVTFALGALAGLLGYVLYRYYKALKKAEFVKKTLEEHVRHFKYLIITDFLNHYIIQEAVVDSEKITSLEEQKEIRIELAPGALVGDYLHISESNPDIALIFGELKQENGKQVVVPILTADELRDPALKKGFQALIQKLLKIIDSLRRAHDEVLDELLSKGVDLLTKIYEAGNVEKRIQAVAWLVAYNDHYFDIFLDAYNEAKGTMLTKPELLKRLEKAEPTLKLIIRQVLQEMGMAGGEE